MGFLDDLLTQITNGNAREADVHTAYDQVATAVPQPPFDQMVSGLFGQSSPRTSGTASGFCCCKRRVRADVSTIPAIITDDVGAACKEQGVGLLLGGAGAWPAQPSFGVRVTSFTAFRDYFIGEGTQR